MDSKNEGRLKPLAGSHKIMHVGREEADANMASTPSDLPTHACASAIPKAKVVWEQKGWKVWTSESEKEAQQDMDLKSAFVRLSPAALFSTHSAGVLSRAAWAGILPASARSSLLNHIFLSASSSSCSSSHLDDWDISIRKVQGRVLCSQLWLASPCIKINLAQSFKLVFFCLVCRRLCCVRLGTCLLFFCAANP